MAEISRASKHAKLDRARCFSSAYPFVRSGRERKKCVFFDFPVFCREKVCRNKKDTRAFGQRKEKKARFSRFSQGKGMQKKKVPTHAFGQRKKTRFFRFYPFFAEKRSVEKNASTCVRAEKEFIFSIFPVFREETARRKKMPTRAFG